MAAYPRILDWSPPARAALVETHRARMAVLLAQSLDQLAEHYGEERLLRTFGFATMGDAIDFCLERFARGDIDPARLHPESRSFRLFTEARFWLAQKVGARVCAQLLARLEHPHEPAVIEPQTGPEDVVDLDVERLVTRLSETLRQLRERTCADVVAWWLYATEALRADWFEHGPCTPRWEPDLKKERALRAHDATFRFQCLHRELVHDDALSPEHIAVREWLFRECTNEPPYRRSEAEIAAALPASAPKGKQDLWRLRRDGVRALLAALLEAAQLRPSAQEPVACMEWQLLRQVLVKTTLVAFKLDEGKAPELERQLARLPAFQDRGESP